MQYLADCTDAGTEYCPCYLAENGECLICSQLSGETFCDCKAWKGTCIYQEFLWNRSRIKEGRKTQQCRVLSQKKLTDSILLFRIDVGRTLARELDQPGAYIFLRSKEHPAFFDTPMSILTSDPETGAIELAVQIRGIKTKALSNNASLIQVRGPYWNGVLGLKYIKSLKNQKALIAARGIGQVPAVAVAKKLVRAGNEVLAILDPGFSGLNLAEKYLQELNCRVWYAPLLENRNLTIPENTRRLLQGILHDEEISFLYSGGSEKLHQHLTALLQQTEADICFACTNDHKFCCGEGICGSCQTRLSNGKRIRTCKAQMNPLYIFEKGVK